MSNPRPWVEATLGDIADIISGATPSTSVEEYWNGDLCWATPKDLSELDGAEISNTARRITENGLGSCAASLLPTNSVLLSSRAPIGLVAINTVPMATNQGFKSLVPDQRRVDPKFLYWWLRRNRPLLESLGNGATFKEISKRTTSSIPILLPQLEEQRRIAAILDAADELRKKRHRTIAKLDDLRKSIFNSIFSASTLVKEIALKDLAERVTVGHVGPTSEHFCDDGVQFLRTGNIGEGQIDWTDMKQVTNEFHGKLAKSQLKAGDLVISRVISDRVRGAVVPDELDGANCANVILVRPSEHVTANYLLGLLQLPEHQSRLLGRKVGSAQSVVNTTTLREWTIPIPGRRELSRYDEATRKVDELNDTLQEQYEGACAMFASLQQRAFRGEL